MWRGKLSALHAVVLIHQLTANPESRVFAIRVGSPEAQGWGQQTLIAARTHNLILSLIHGLSGTKNGKGYIDHPASKEEAETTVIQPRTLAELTDTMLANFVAD